jgi:DNA uptake protein ComE-like DNA-binding protein
MGFNTLLLLAAVWLLWTISLNSKESIDRQRQLKSELDKITARLDGNNNSKINELIDLNTATKARLQSLPRIGAISAEHIIAARPLQSIEQLRNVTGITHSVFDEIKGRVTV